MLRLKFAYCFIFMAIASLITSHVASGVQITIGAAPGRGMDTVSPAEKTAKKKKAKKSKYINLLESKDLSSFRGYKTEEIGDGWSIKGKSLHFDGTEGTGDIITREKYTDFELQFDWKISEGGNSGVMYRVGLGDQAPYITGVEYQILDDSKHADGKTPETSAGSVYALFAPKEYRKKAVGGWNKSRIVVDGSKITHVLNGTRVVEVDMDSDAFRAKVGNSKFKDWEKFAKEKSGHIAFQDHGNKVWYRNIKIRSSDNDSMAGAALPGAGRPDGSGTRKEPGLGRPGGRRAVLQGMGAPGSAGAGSGKKMGK